MTAAATPEGVSIESRDGVLRITLDRPARKNSLDTAAIRRIVAALEAAATDDSLRVVAPRRQRSGLLLRRGLGGVQRGRDATSDGKPPAAHAAAGAPADRAAHGAPAAGRLRGARLGGRARLPAGARRRLHDRLRVGLLLGAVHRARASARTAARPGCCRGSSASRGPRSCCCSAGSSPVRRLRPGGSSTAPCPTTSSNPPPRRSSSSSPEAATVAIGLTKHCIHRSLETGLVEAMQGEAFALELSSRTADFKEGLLAFKERRAARFEGR